MSLSYKIIPSRFKNITLCLGISMLCFLSVTFLTGSIFGININGDISGNNTSALTYSTEQDISFTFAPSLSITLSDTDLIIDTLAPGNTAESNTITVSVASNTPYGYALYADVGSNDASSQYYNTSSLIRSDNINATFTSIATNASQASLTTDNTWGYSTSKDDGTTWSTYNGLPAATNTSGSTSTDNPAILIDTKLPADNQSIAIKVAARSSTTQASGAYSNIINFYAVGKPAPMDLATVFASSGLQKTPQGYYRMQDMTTELCDSVEEIHSTIRLQDVRDNEVYTVAKLKDNNCWMTENLNLAGGTEITSELSDVPENYTLPVANGFQSGNRLPWSSQSFNYDNMAVVYNSGKSSESCFTEGCYSYYSWTAATAGSAPYASSSNTTPYSICPKGWTLPKISYRLHSVYGQGQDFYKNAGPGTVPNFLPAGSYQGSYLYEAGEIGTYNRPVKWGSNATWYFRFGATFSTEVGSNNNFGASVRCSTKQY